MITLSFILLAIAAGIVVGAVGHAKIAKESAASQIELQQWATKLRGVFDTDSQSAKNAVKALVQEIEQKLT